MDHDAIAIAKLKEEMRLRHQRYAAAPKAPNEAMALTGHRSVQTFIGYYRSGEVTNSSAARLMDRSKGTARSRANAASSSCRLKAGRGALTHRFRCHGD